VPHGEIAGVEPAAPERLRGGVGLLDPVFYQLVGQLRRHEIARVEITLGLQPEGPGGQICVKQALPYVRALGENWPMPPERILYYGESLGAAVITELATEYPPAGLVLRSPFVDLASVGQVHYPFLPVRALLRDRYPLAEQLANVTVPVTVVYGSDDSIVPPAHSRTVAESAPQLRQLVEVAGADHNAPALLDGEALVNAVVDLADQIEQPS